MQYLQILFSSEQLTPVYCIRPSAPLNFFSHCALAFQISLHKSLLKCARSYTFQCKCGWVHAAFAELLVPAAPPLLTKVPFVYRLKLRGRGTFFE